MFSASDNSLKESNNLQAAFMNVPGLTSKAFPREQPGGPAWASGQAGGQGGREEPHTVVIVMHVVGGYFVPLLSPLLYLT